MLCCGPCGVDEYCVAHWPHLQLRGIETTAMIKEMRGPTIHAGFSSPSVLPRWTGFTISCSIFFLSNQITTYYPHSNHTRKSRQVNSYSEAQLLSSNTI